MCIWRHKLCNAKTGVALGFTWSNEACYMLFGPKFPCATINLDDGLFGWSRITVLEYNLGSCTYIWRDKKLQSYNCWCDFRIVKIKLVEHKFGCQNLLFTNIIWKDVH